MQVPSCQPVRSGKWRGIRLRPDGLDHSQVNEGFFPAHTTSKPNAAFCVYVGADGVPLPGCESGGTRSAVQGEEIVMLKKVVRSRSLAWTTLLAGALMFLPQFGVAKAWAQGDDNKV